MEEEAQRDQSTPPSKVTPLQLRERYHLNIANLAHKAKVEADTVYFLMVGRPIARQQAELILATISTLVKRSYTLENVQVALLPEGEEQTEATDGAPSSGEGQTK